jgi:myosin-crossreactive antigen
MKKPGRSRAFIRGKKSRDVRVYISCLVAFKSKHLAKLRGDLDEGLASLTAAAYLIRHGRLLGKNINVYEARSRLGGASRT